MYLDCANYYHRSLVRFLWKQEAVNDRILHLPTVTALYYEMSVIKFLSR